MRRMQHCGGQVDACMAQMRVAVAATAVLSARDQHARHKLMHLRCIAAQPHGHNAVSLAARKAEQLFSQTEATERRIVAGALSTHQQRPPILPTAPIRDMLQFILQVNNTRAEKLSAVLLGERRLICVYLLLSASAPHGRERCECSLRAMSS